MTPNGSLLLLAMILSPMLVGAADTNLLLPPKEAADHPNPSGPVPTEARRIALQTAGAFVNDGFRIRDGEWPISLSLGKPVFLEVTLFAGNSYWFVASSADPVSRLRVTVYDSAGTPQKGEQWKDGGKSSGDSAAAGVAPERSGKYYVGVELLESPRSGGVDCCLVYAYK